MIEAGAEGRERERGGGKRREKEGKEGGSAPSTAHLSPQGTWQIVFLVHSSTENSNFFRPRVQLFVRPRGAASQALSGERATAREAEKI